MRGRRDQDLVNRRCAKLEDLGFEIDNEDYRVRLGKSFDSGQFRDFYIDFSAIAEDQFVAYAAQKVFEYGIKIGENRIRQGIRDILEPTEDD